MPTTLQGSHRVLDGSTPRGIVATPLTSEFGLEISELDLGALIEGGQDCDIEWLRQQLDARLLMLFRGQKLSQQQLVKLMRYFGPLAPVRTEGSSHQVLEGIKLITNQRDEKGKSLGDPPPYELGWHTDGSYMKAPTAYTALYCVAAPTNDPPVTYWMSMQTTFERMSAERQDELAAIRVLHYSPKNPTRYAPEGAPMVGQCRATEHPLVRVIPETGRAAVLIGSVPDTPLVVAGKRWDQVRSKAFLDNLVASGLQVGESWQCALQADDLVIWDNRAMAHKRDNIGPEINRILWHVAVAGEEPVALAK